MITYHTPERPDPRIRTRLIEELAARYLEMVQTHRGGIIYLAGEPGAGRTQTLAAFRDRLGKLEQRPILLPLDFLPEASLDELSLSPNIVELLGQLLPLAMAAGDPLLTLITGFLGQLLQVSGSAYALALQLAARSKGQPRLLDPTEVIALVRRASRDRPVVCLFDHFDQAPTSWWNSFLRRGFAVEAAHDRIMVLVALDGSARPAPPQPDQEPNALSTAHALCSSDANLALWRYLGPLTASEVTEWAGKSEPSLPEQLFAISRGNPKWLRLLWDDWWKRGLLEADPNTIAWRLKDQRAGLGTTDDVCGRRLQELLVNDVGLVDDTQRMLSIAALEGKTFTPAALAAALERNEDELLDFFDELLLQDVDQPAGLLREVTPPFVAVARDGSERMLYRYAFVSDLVHFTLLHRGLTPEERLSWSGKLARALDAAYESDHTLIAWTLARLYRSAGIRDRADHFTTMAANISDVALLRARAYALMAEMQAHGETWDSFDYHEAATLLLDAGDRMRRRYPITEALEVLTAARTAAMRIPLEEKVARADLYTGHAFTDAGKFAWAEQSLQRAFQSFRACRSRGGEAASLSGLGTLAHSQGRYHEAKPYFERALAIFEEVLGSQHPSTAGSLNNLGGLLQAMGELAEARPYYERALAICEEALGPKHPDTALSLNNLGGLLHTMGQLAEAKPYVERALAICEEVLGPDHPNTEITRGNLARLDEELRQ